jgi:hypothetical protein
MAVKGVRRRRSRDSLAQRDRPRTLIDRRDPKWSAKLIDGRLGATVHAGGCNREIMRPDTLASDTLIKLYDCNIMN